MKSSEAGLPACREDAARIYEENSGGWPEAVSMNFSLTGVKLQAAALTDAQYTTCLKARIIRTFLISHPKNNPLTSRIDADILGAVHRNHRFVKKGKSVFIPGFIISILTFPGVVVHEFAHRLFCRLTGTRVMRVCYFRFGNPAGYVIHEAPESVWRHILIGIGPFFVNTALGLLAGLLAVGKSLHAGQLKGEGFFLVWLGLSIAIHSFPSTGDAKSIWRALWGKGAPLSAKLVGAPLVGLIFLGALGSFFWLDLAYGIGVAMVLPWVIIG